jgi:molybdopterin synthase sulfur carrier subunit
MQVTVYGPLRAATGEKTVAVSPDGDRVQDVVEALVREYPSARSHLFDGDALRPSVRIAVDGDRADPDAPCPSDATVTLHPAVQGG